MCGTERLPERGPAASDFLKIFPEDRFWERPINLKAASGGLASPQHDAPTVPERWFGAKGHPQGTDDHARGERAPGKREAIRPAFRERLTKVRREGFLLCHQEYRPVATKPMDLMARISEAWRDLRFPVLLAIASAAITLGFGSIAFQVAENSRAAWPEIFMRWDAAHYAAMASAGYSASPERAFLICFFPLFPLLAAPIAWLTGSAAAALLLVANVACIAAFASLYRLASLEYGQDAAARTTVIAAIFPTAYFFHLPYAESLSLATSAAAFLAARKSRWGWVAIFSLLASLTRPIGIVLLPALLVEYLQQKNFRWRAVRADILCVLAPLAGAGIYLAINRFVFADPLRFVSLQQEIFHRKLAWPWEGLMPDLTRFAIADPVSQIMTNGAHLATFAVFSGLLLWGIFKLRSCYTVYFAGLWVLTFSYDFWLSVPRLALAMFPAFFLAAIALEKRQVLQFALGFASVLLYGLALTQFVRGHWAY